MLAVSRGSSGRYHIFRGDQAREFLNGLTANSMGRGVLLLPGRGRVAFMHYRLTGGNSVIVMLDENLCDEHAAAALDAVLTGRANPGGPFAPFN